MKAEFPLVVVDASASFYILDDSGVALKGNPRLVVGSFPTLHSNNQQPHSCSCSLLNLREPQTTSTPILNILAHSLWAWKNSMHHWQKEDESMYQFGCKLIDHQSKWRGEWVGVCIGLVGFGLLEESTS